MQRFAGRRALRFLVMVSSAIGWGACGDDSEGSGTLAADCARACETASALSCPADTGDCASQCVQRASASPACAEAYGAAIACAATTTGADWECGLAGESQLKDSVCVAEGSALATCGRAGAGSGG